MLDRERRRGLETANEDRQNRYNVLPILFDVTNTLSRLRLPFKGHDESEFSHNRGVFVEVVNLVSRWNTDLAAHLHKAGDNPKGYPSYMSASSQNEMINSSADQVREQILRDVKSAKYFALCLDTTPDAGRQDQLSVIVRYTDSNGQIREDMLDLTRAEDMTAEGLYNLIEATLTKFGLRLADVRGQGYDGCSTMSGCYSGLQTRIRQESKQAYYVHCYAHRLNLVIVDTCSGNVAVRNFFGTVGALYDFIEGSTKRHGAFQAIREAVHMEAGSESSGGYRTLHSMSSTRWSARVDNCKALLNNLLGVVRTLETISTSSNYDRKTAGDAVGLLKSLDFKFCLALVIMSDLLAVSHVVSKSLQSPKLNIAAAASQVQCLKDEIASRRADEKFAAYWNEASLVAETIGVEYNERRRPRRVSRRLDDMWRNEAQVSEKDRLRIEVYFDVIDRFTAALAARFSADVMPLLSATDCLIRPAVDKAEQVMQLVFLSR